MLLNDIMSGSLPIIKPPSEATSGSWSNLERNLVVGAIVDNDEIKLPLIHLDSQKFGWQEVRLSLTKVSLLVEVLENEMASQSDEYPVGH